MLVTMIAVIQSTRETAQAGPQTGFRVSRGQPRTTARLIRRCAPVCISVHLRAPSCDKMESFENSAQAAQQLELAVDLLPEWSGSYSTLGVFYYQTGQIEKAREVLDRFKGSNADGLDTSRIQEVLSRAPATSPSPKAPLSMEARQQLLQLALVIADRTL